MGLPRLRMIVRPGRLPSFRPVGRVRPVPIPGFTSPNPIRSLAPAPGNSKITQSLLFRTHPPRVLAVVQELSSVAMLVYGGMLVSGLVPGAESGEAQAGLLGGLLGFLGEGWNRLSSMISSPEPAAPKRPVRLPTPVGGVAPARRPSGPRPAGHPDTAPLYAGMAGRGPSRSNVPVARQEPRVTAPGAMVAEAVQVRMRLLEEQVGHPVRIARRLGDIENILPEEVKDGIFVVVKCVDKTIEVRIANHGEADRLVLEGEHKKSGGPIPINRAETIIMLARLGGMKE